MKEISKRRHRVLRPVTRTMMRHLGSEDHVGYCQSRIRKMTVYRCKKPDQCGRTLPPTHGQLFRILRSRHRNTIGRIVVRGFLRVPNHHDFCRRHFNSSSRLFQSLVDARSWLIQHTIPLSLPIANIFSIWSTTHSEIRRPQRARQPMTKLRPTAVSRVALAACNETDQVWSPMIPSTVTPPQV